MENTQEIPRGRRKEIHTGDMLIGQRPDIVLPNEGPLSADPETIIPVDTPLHSGYYEELQFMEEPVTIRMERSSEKFAPQLIDVYVNGVVKWIPVGTPVTVARKYVEVLARSKPDSVQTVVGTENDDNPENHIRRYTSSKHPFTVINDTGKGIEWLTRVMAEG